MRLIALLVVLGACAVAQPAEDPDQVAKTLYPKNERIHKLRLREVAEHLRLKAGSRVADVGCGSGEVAVIWSRAVGSSGRVYAEDIQKNRLSEAKKVARKHKADNMTFLQGEAKDPKLPVGELDGVFLLDVYHELKDYPAMLKHFLAALKPGGRLVIIDPVPRKVGSRSREVQMKNHVLMPDIAEKDLKEAGFSIVHRDGRFLDDPDSEDMQWLLVAEK